MTHPSQDPQHPFAQGRYSVPQPYDPYAQAPPPPLPPGPATPQYAIPFAAPPVRRGGFKSLSRGRRTAIFVGGGLAALLLLCCGGSALVGAVGGDARKQPASAQGSDPTGNQAVADARTTTSAAAVAPAQPRVETRTVTETQAIPFTRTTVNDSSMAKGTTDVRTSGVDGVKTLTYQVTYTDGVETGRKLVSEAVTTKPVNEVTAVGTKAQAQSNCDPNYTGCVPIASDVDCAGGSGNGPAYVKGPVTVIGTDIYKLDTDHDGVACED